MDEECFTVVFASSIIIIGFLAIALGIALILTKLFFIEGGRALIIGFLLSTIIEAIIIAYLQRDQF